MPNKEPEKTNTGFPLVSDVELENIRRIFNQFDKDHSESIDVFELKDVMASLGVLMDEQHLTELLEQVSVGGKDELDFDEFISLITLWKEASQYKLFDMSGFKSLAQQHVENALSTECFLSDTHWRAAWDMVVCLAAVIYWFFVLLLDAYGTGKFNTNGLIAGDAILTLVFAIDMIICSHTCVVEEVGLEDNSLNVAVKYAKTWLIADILATFPFDIVLTSQGYSAAATVLRHFRLLKLLKIPYLWQASGHIPITSKYIKFHFHILPLLLLVILFVCMVHGFSIGWILMKLKSCRDENPGGDCDYSYTHAVYLVMYVLSTVGLGDVSVDNDAQRSYLAFVMLGAMATTGIVVGKLVSILQRADLDKERRGKLRETLAVLDHFGIPKQLQEEILQFQAHLLDHNLGAAYEEIVSGLPSEMRNNISLFVKIKLIGNVPVFVSSHYMLRIAVAQSLESAVARPEQYIVVAGQESDGLYFLAYGYADVFTTSSVYVGTLASGDFFGEDALLGCDVQNISVKAITYCDLWILSRSKFAAILKRFPKFNSHVEEWKTKNPLAATTDDLARVDTQSRNAITGVFTGPLPSARKSIVGNQIGNVARLKNLLHAIATNKAALKNTLDEAGQVLPALK